MAGRIRHELWLIFFAVLVVAGIITGQVLIGGFGILGLIIGSIAWLWSRLSLEEVTYERSLARNRAFVGDEVPITVSITNKKPVPLGWLRLYDRIPPDVEVRGGQMGEQVGATALSLMLSTSMGWYERVVWEYRLKCTARGYFRLGPARLESGDLFGFFTSEKTAPGRDDLLVYPETATLPELGIPALKPMGDARNGLLIYRDTSRPGAARDYQRGDPLKWVDWKLSAKTGRLQVRVFDPSSSTTIVLIVAVDTNPINWGGYSPVLLERVIKVAASVAIHAVEEGYELGLFSNGSAIRADRPMVIPPSGEPAQLPVILEALATITPVVMSPIHKRLGDHARRFPMGSTLVIATAIVSPELAAVVSSLKKRGHPVVVLYVAEGACPDLPEGVVVHELGERLSRAEAASEFGPR